MRGQKNRGCGRGVNSRGAGSRGVAPRGRGHLQPIQNHHLPEVNINGPTPPKVLHPLPSTYNHTPSQDLIQIGARTSTQAYSGAMSYKAYSNNITTTRPPPIQTPGNVLEGAHSNSHSHDHTSAFNYHDESLLPFHDAPYTQASTAQNYGEEYASYYDDPRDRSPVVSDREEEYEDDNAEDGAGLSSNIPRVDFTNEGNQQLSNSCNTNVSMAHPKAIPELDLPPWLYKHPISNKLVFDVSLFDFYGSEDYVEPKPQKETAELPAEQQPVKPRMCPEVDWAYSDAATCTCWPTFKVSSVNLAKYYASKLVPYLSNGLDSHRYREFAGNVAGLFPGLQSTYLAFSKKYAPLIKKLKEEAKNKSLAKENRTHALHINATTFDFELYSDMFLDQLKNQVKAKCKDMNTWTVKKPGCRDAISKRNLEKPSKKKLRFD